MSNILVGQSNKQIYPDAFYITDTVALFCNIFSLISNCMVLFSYVFQRKLFLQNLVFLLSLISFLQSISNILQILVFKLVYRFNEALGGSQPTRFYHEFCDAFGFLQVYFIEVASFFSIYFFYKLNQIPHLKKTLARSIPKIKFSQVASMFIIPIISLIPVFFQDGYSQNTMWSYDQLEIEEKLIGYNCYIGYPRLSDPHKYPLELIVFRFTLIYLPVFTSLIYNIVQLVRIKQNIKTQVNTNKSKESEDNLNYYIPFIIQIPETALAIINMIELFSNAFASVTWLNYITLSILMINYLKGIGIAIVFIILVSQR